MGKTITEKILAKAAQRSEVVPGEYLEITSSRPVTLHASMTRGPGQLKAMGVTKVFDPTKIKVVDGHNGATASHSAAKNRKAVIEWAESVGVPRDNIWEIGRSGIEHLIAGENCWPLPGEVYFQVVNGHTSTLGALGAFAVTLSYGSGAYLMKGKTWVKVPESVLFVVEGTLPEGVYARDVFEYILGAVGPSACVGMVMEWAGKSIDDMDMDGRFSLCCNALFTGAWTAIMNPDQTSLSYVRSRTAESFDPLSSDQDAHYAKRYVFDVSNIVPQIVPPPERYHVKPVTAFEGTLINRGFIGSCADSRIEDLRVAAEVLRGRKLHPRAVLNVTPGTPSIYRQAMHEGLIDIFMDAGCLVASPACGMCWGANTPLADGDTCLSTGTCNYPGRMGSKKADIYLGSPATVAAGCVEGKIVDPRNYLQPAYRAASR